ncbi:hypothetical protein M0804_008467 [Polistes exclamans]|nr:hypothetical protein M0804_008467 [Polistes exclamans]
MIDNDDDDNDDENDDNDNDGGDNDNDDDDDDDDDNDGFFSRHKKIMVDNANYSTTMITEIVNTFTTGPELLYHEYKPVVNVLTLKNTCSSEGDEGLQLPVVNDIPPFQKISKLEI